MQEVPLRARVPWVAVPVFALLATIAVLTAGVEREPLSGEDIPLLATALAIVFAAPLGLMLAFVRGRVAWAVAVVLLTGVCVAAPILVEVSSDESSTAGLAYLLIPVIGTAVVLLVALADAVLRRQR